MTKPSSFIINTDYATLRNDAKTGTTLTPDLTIVIPANIIIPASGYLEYHADVNIGVRGAISALRIKSSKDSNKWIRAQVAGYERNGTNGGFPAIYNVMAFAFRLNASTIRCVCYIRNPYDTVTNGESTPETITFHINTFIPPFA